MENKKPRSYGNHVVQYPMDYSLCAGCTTCEIVCTLTHDGLVSPSYNRIFVDRGTRSMVHTILSCQHCSDHPCYDACPKKDKAMCIDENNIVYVNEDECVGCGLCQKACAFRLHASTWSNPLTKSSAKLKNATSAERDPKVLHVFSGAP